METPFWMDHRCTDFPFGYLHLTFLSSLLSSLLKPTVSADLLKPVLLPAPLLSFYRWTHVKRMLKNCEQRKIQRTLCVENRKWNSKCGNETKKWRYGENEQANWKRVVSLLSHSFPVVSRWSMAPRHIYLQQSSGFFPPNPHGRVSFLNLPLLCQHLFCKSLAGTLSFRPWTEWQITAVPTSSRCRSDARWRGGGCLSSEYRWCHVWLICTLRWIWT